MPQALGERRLEKGLGIDAAKYLVQGLLRCRPGDAHGLNLLLHAQLAALADRGFTPGDRLGDAGVVDGALVFQAGDGLVDEVGVVRAAGQALPDLRFGQLAPGEHPQRVEVGAVRAHRPTVDQLVKRVTSGDLPVVMPCAICSRLMSAVVEMPCTFSLNSSTLLAARSA